MLKSSVYRLFFVLMVVLAIPALAQEELTETYLAADEAFIFNYPSGWDVVEDQDFVTLTSPATNGAFVIVQLFSPEYVRVFAPDASTAQEAMDAIKPYFSDIISGDGFEIDSGGRAAVIAEISNDTQEGMAVVVAFSNGEFGMVQAFSEPGNFESFVETVMAILFTFDTAVSTSASVDAIANYDGDWEAVVAELEAQEVIASGGSLVFQENTTFFEGQGNFFTPLATNQPFADLVMAGELSFTESDPGQIETCSLLARIGEDANGDAETFIDVGFVTGGDVFVQDRFSPTDDATFESVSLGLNLDQSHHLLFVLIDDTLDLYVDGELVLDDFLVGNRSGTYGIALRGAARGARCEGRNVWVYQAPVFTPGLCEIIPSDTVNMRSGPGTSFDRAGQLAAGTIIRAEGRATDNDGFQWWLLENGNWVREDVVRAQGDCANLPVSS
jgi:hypothetical protein